jgi:hypothetical protein
LSPRATPAKNVPRGDSLPEAKNPQRRFDMKSITTPTTKINLKFLDPGSVVYVQTRNTIYRIERKEIGMTIFGHATYCPTDRPCLIYGFLGGICKPNFIEVGGHMSYTTAAHMDVQSSEIKAIWGMEDERV